MAKQLRLRHRFIDDHEVFFVEEFFQHIRPGAIHQHQLAELFHLIFRRERRQHHHRLILLADARIRDNKIFVNVLQFLVIAQGYDLLHHQLRILTADLRLNHTDGGIAGIAHHHYLRMALIADVVVPLQPDADVQHQKTDFVFAQRIRRIFPPAGDRRQRDVIRHRIMLFDVTQQRIRDVYLIFHPRNHGLDMREQIRT